MSGTVLLDHLRAQFGALAAFPPSGFVLSLRQN
jgi:hypothetical protein